MLRIVLVLAAGLLASSCIGPGACTLIGCSNQVTFQLGTTGQQFGVNEPVLVRACIGSQCAQETVTNTSAGSSSSSGPSLALNGNTLTFQFGAAVTGTQTVTLELRKNGNVVFSDQRDNVALVSSSPNGPGCGPICQQATIAL